VLLSGRETDEAAERGYVMKNKVIKSSRLEAEHEAWIRKMRNTYEMSIRKSAGRRPLRRP
jgi:hypothetical protein